MQKLTECGKNPMGLYEVCRGDTAESVAARLGVTGADLAQQVFRDPVHVAHDLFRIARDIGNHAVSRNDACR